jgi:phage/plasmid primase-like uncharacterized protein
MCPIEEGHHIGCSRGDKWCKLELKNEIQSQKNFEKNQKIALKENFEKSPKLKSRHQKIAKDVFKSKDDISQAICIKTKNKNSRFVALSVQKLGKVIAEGRSVKSVIKKAEKSGKQFSMMYIPPKGKNIYKWPS